MVDDAAGGEGPGPATPLAPGPLVTIGDGALEVDIAARAGGRIAQIRCDGVEQLVGHASTGPRRRSHWLLSDGPVVGRIRRGVSRSRREYRLVMNRRPRDPTAGSSCRGRWHGPRRRGWNWLPQTTAGVRRHRGTAHRGAGRGGAGTVGHRRAGDAVAIGWHPWFRKPERRCSRARRYPRDSGIAVLPPGPVQPGPGTTASEPPRGRAVPRRPVHPPGVGVQRLGGVRRTGVRDLRRAADRPARCVQPGARAGAAAGGNAGGAVLAALGVGGRARRRSDGGAGGCRRAATAPPPVRCFRPPARPRAGCRRLPPAG